MSLNLDYSVASSEQIEAELCRQLGRIRLSKNMTQQRVAELSGLSKRTIIRMEQGQGVSLDAFLRVLIALSLQSSLATLLPDPSVRPMERVDRAGRERQRARPRSEP